MRTSLTLSAILAAAILLLGMWTEGRTCEVARQYMSAAEEIQTLIQMDEWDRAAQATESYWASWQKTLPWLQTLVVHEDADQVSMALRRLAAGIGARDLSLALEGCAELREHAEHLHHRDALKLGTIL